MTSNTTQEEKANAFRALHEGEPFVIPNPWDSGSAKVLAWARHIYVSSYML